MTLAVTKAVYITISSAGFVLATAYLLTGQRTHSNAKTPRRLRVSGITRSLKKSNSILYNK